MSKKSTQPNLWMLPGEYSWYCPEGVSHSFTVSCLYYEFQENQWKIYDALRFDEKVEFVREDQASLRYSHIPGGSYQLKKFRNKRVRRSWQSYEPTYYAGRKLPSGTRIKIIRSQSEFYVAWIENDTITEGLQCSGNISVECYGTHWKGCQINSDETILWQHAVTIEIMLPE